MNHMGSIKDFGTTARRIMLLGLMVVLTGCGSNSDPVEQLKIAKEAFSNKNFQVMEIALKSLLRDEPDNAEGRYLLGLANLEYGRGQAAEIQLLKALDGGVEKNRISIPLLQALMHQRKYDEVISSEKSGQIAGELSGETDVAQLNAIIGIAHLAKGQNESAQQRFEVALSKQENNGYALVGLAQLALQAKDFEGGFQLAKEAVEKAPKFAAGWSLLGDIYRAKQQPADAEPAYTKALELRPIYPEDLLNLVQVKIEQSDLDGAEKDIKTLKKQGFNNPHGLFADGLLNFRRGNVGLARDSFEIVVSDNPDYMQAVCYLGLTLAASDNYVRAETSLKRCVEVFPAASYPRRIYGALLASENRYDEAEQMLKPLVNQSPPDIDATNVMARIETSRGDNDKAVQLLKQLVAQTEDNPSSHLNLAMALINVGRDEEASEVFARAGELNETLKVELIEAQTLLKAGKVAEAMQKLRSVEAMQKLRSVVDREPKNIQAANLLAISHGQLKEYKKSKRVLTEALTHHPEYVPALLNLAKTYVDLKETNHAVDTLERVLSIEPLNVRALGMLTGLELQQNKGAKVKERLAKAFEQTREPSAELLLLDARVKRSFGEFEAAARIFEKLIATYGSEMSWLRALGQSQLQAEQHQQAIKTLTVLTASPGHTAADYVLLANALEASGDRRGAKKAVGSALEKSPNYPLARLLDVKFLIFDKDIGKARERFDSLLAVAPNRERPELLSVEGAILLLEGNEKDAINLFERAYELDNSSQRAVDLAKSYAAVGNRQRAISLLETRLRDNPTEFNIKFVLADAHWKGGNLEKAIAGYSELLDTNPKNPIVLNNFAAVLVETDSDRALELIKRAYREAPESPVILDTYGVVLTERNEYDEAKEMLKKALSIQPENNEILLHYLKVLVLSEDYRAAKPVLGRIDQESLSDADKESIKKFSAALE